MLCVIAFCSRDAGAASNLLRWMAELDGIQERHRVLLVAASTVSTSVRDEVRDFARTAFTTNYLVHTLREDERPWPYAPNAMFQCAARYIDRVFACPFWWNEPDCIPLVPGWLDRLEAEYRAMNKPFMGSVVTQPVRHLTGCAVYPHRLDRYNPAIMAADKYAFDCVRPELTLKHTHHTTLFHHQWNGPDGRSVPSFPTAADLGIIRSDAVVFHRNKDHTLIDRLREERAVEYVDDAGKPITEPPVESEATVVAAPVRAESLRVEGLVLSGGSFVPEQPAALSVPRPPIYTYYEPVPGHDYPVELLRLWKTLWSAQGWNPVILTEDDARDDAQYLPFARAIEKLPTVNAPAYERACYMRHLAMAGMNGGFLTDYDVLPRAFTPDDCKAAYVRPLTIFEPTLVPCAVRGGATGFRQIVDLIVGYQPTSDDVYAGRPHVSDMTIIRGSKFRSTNHCVEHLCSGQPIRDHLGDGWRHAPMIHFSTGSFRKLGWSGSKADMIKRALAELGASSVRPLATTTPCVTN